MPVQTSVAIPIITSAHAHGVEDVAPLDKTAVEKGQPGRHQKHQRRAVGICVVGSGTAVPAWAERCSEKQGWDSRQLIRDVDRKATL